MTVSVRALVAFALALSIIGGAGAAVQAQTRTVESEHGPITVTVLARGLDHPWGLEFLPDGRMLVTERAGRMRVITADGRTLPPLKGLPAVHAVGQGGLLDVALAPDFAASRLVYFCYAEAGDGGAGTALGRGRLSSDDTALEAVQVIFRQQPKVSGPNHFGCRIAFAPDGRLFLTLGERFKFAPAQDLMSHLGKVVRLNPDGTVPADNPFVGRGDARPEIWSYGHRNPQGAAIQPGTGALWISEFGPRGGDELNLPEKGRNYGWPLVSWGDHYSGEPIPKPPSRPDLAPPAYYWNPAISPSGISFYTGDLFPAWRGSLLLGGLSSQALIRAAVDGNRVTGEERIPLNARIRDVKPGPDGAIYLLTDKDSGEILRLTPAPPN
jgi:glucose/arabinose dehydrogenase